MFVGLGNPGKDYSATRHNIGFLFLDYIAKKNSLVFSFKKKLNGDISLWKSPDFGNVTLLKPLTYMNLSGNTVQSALEFYKITQQNIIVIHDDLDLPFSIVRTRDKGSAGGHNGLKSIGQSIGTLDFSRIKIGISNERLIEFKQKKQKERIVDFVLEPFYDNELKLLPDVFNISFQALREFIKNKTNKTYQI